MKLEIDVMEKCLEFFDGRPDDWKLFENEGRCDRCERTRVSVCVDDMRGGPHCCVATIHAPGDELDAEELAGMVAWQIQTFASPKSARAVIAALKAAEKMAGQIDAFIGAQGSESEDGMREAADAFRKAMRGET